MRSGITRDCLKCMGKVPVDRERLTMVVIIGRIVSETSFKRKVWIGSRSHCLFGDACKSLAISSVGAGGNDDNTLGERGDWNEMTWVKGQMEVSDEEWTLYRKKMKQRIQREMVWVLKMAVRWFVYDIVRSFYFSRGDVCFDD